MAVVVDATADGTSGSGDLTFAHTCSSSAKALFVAVTKDAAGVNGVTYNGVSMTLLRTNIPTSPPGTNCPGIKLYGLNNPDAGTYNIVVDAGAAGVDAMSISYNGVNISTSPESYLNNDSSNIQSTSWTGFVTSTVNNALAVMFVAGENFPRTFTAGANTTVRRTVCHNKSMAFVDCGSAINTPAGVTLAVDYSASTGFTTAISFILNVEETPLTKTETITVTDLLTRTGNRFLTETITIVDAVNRTMGRLVSELVTITDTLANIKGTWYQVAYVEALTITDSIVNSFVFFITAVENLTVTDVVLDFAKKLRGLIRGKKNDINTKIGVRRT